MRQKFCESRKKNLFKTFVILFALLEAQSFLYIDYFRKLLSPDLFPFYKDDTGNSILPIPEVLEKSGLNSRDRDSILELVMDVAG